MTDPDKNARDPGPADGGGSPSPPPTGARSSDRSGPIPGAAPRPRPQTQSILSTLASLGVPVAKATEAGAATGERYTVLEELAQGGMGVVFKVRDEDLRRDLAMKVLHRAKGHDPTGDSSRSDPRFVGRFLEEAQVSGQLDHPGIVPIHELGLDADGRLFFTMRLVRGRTLAEVFEMARRNQNGWSMTRALGVLLKVCEAMAYAHHKRVIHRDLKPANIMVGRFGETYVMDWGLAKLLDDHVATPTWRKDAAKTTLSIVHTDRKDMAVGDGTGTLDTMSGDVVGTPAYMAPEQARGEIEKLGPAADVYAVGALLYHLLTGQPPYLEPGTRTSPHTVLRWVLDGPPKPVAELAPKQPAELAAICERAMAREPGQRYESMLALAEDIQAYIEDRVVAAYQSGAVAEFRKWVTRNKGMAASILVAIAVALAGLGGVGWVQAQGRKEVAAKADELAESNEALAGANAALESANTDLELATAEAQAARDAAVASERLAVSNEARASASEAEALRQSYVANIAAAGTALEQGAAGAARRHLAATSPDLRGWEWKHLSLAADPSLATLQGHQSNVWSVAFSPDGRLLASGSGPYYGFGGADSDARIWNVETGEELHVLPGHRLAVTCLDFSPDGEVLVTGCVDGTIRRFDVRDGSTLGSPRYLGGYVTGIRHFADGDRIALCTNASDTGGTHVVEIWNTRTLDVEFRYESRRGARTLAISPDERWLAVGFQNYTIQMWDTATHELVWEWEHPARDTLAPVIGYLRGVLSLAFSPDGARLLATSSDNRLRTWDMPSGEALVDLSLTRGLPSAGAWSPDGRWMLVGDLSGAMQFFDAETAEALEVLNGHDQFLTALAFSPDGSRIASGSWDRTVRIWDGRPGSAVTVLHPHTAKWIGSGGVDERNVHFAPDGRRLAWRAGNTLVHLIDSWTGEFLYSLDSAGMIRGLTFTPDGARILYVSLTDGLQVFDAATGTLVASPTGALGSPQRVAFNRDCTLLALCSGRAASTSSRRIDIYDVASGRRAAQLRGHRDTVNHGAFTPDGRRFVSPSADGTIRVWDLASGETVRVIETGGEPWRVLITNDGQQIIASSWDPSKNGLHRWDLETGELLGVQPGRSLFVACRLSADGERVVSANLDGTVGLWDLEQGEILTLPGSEGPMVNACFSPDGQRVAAVNNIGRLSLWESLPTAEREEARREASYRERRLDEFRGRLDAMRDEHRFASELADAVRRLPDLDPELRSLALREIRVFGDNKIGISRSLWGTILRPGDTEEEYRRCLEIADRLIEELPGFEQPLHIRAWVNYRLGRWHDARADALAARGSDFTFNSSLPQWDGVLRSLIASQLGDLDEAAHQLREGQDALQEVFDVDPRNAGPLIEPAVREAEALLAEKRGR